LKRGGEKRQSRSTGGNPTKKNTAPPRQQREKEYRKGKSRNKTAAENFKTTAPQKVNHSAKLPLMYKKRKKTKILEPGPLKESNGSAHE